MIVTALNSRAQERIARRKLRLDLYDRRLALWDRCDKLLSELRGIANVQPDPKIPWEVSVTLITSELWKAQRDMRYLFDKQCLDAVEAYIEATNMLTQVRIEQKKGQDDPDTIHRERLSEMGDLHRMIPKLLANVITNIDRHLDFTRDTVDSESYQFMKKLAALRARNIARRHAQATPT